MAIIGILRNLVPRVSLFPTLGTRLYFTVHNYFGKTVQNKISCSITQHHVTWDAVTFPLEMNS